MSYDSYISHTTSYQQTYHRFLYYTPKHYIDLLLYFQSLYHENQTRVREEITRLTQGVITLEETRTIVASLQQELVVLEPILEIKTIEAEQLLDQVNIDQQAAGHVAQRVAQDERIVKQQQREIAACQLDAQHDLELALQQ